MKKNSSLITKQNKKEIFYNLINSGIAGAISFFSAALAASEIDFRVIMIAIASAALVACIKFRDYWDGEKSEYCHGLVNFL